MANLKNPVWQVALEIVYILLFSFLLKDNSITIYRRNLIMLLGIGEEMSQITFSVVKKYY